VAEPVGRAGASGASGAFRVLLLCTGNSARSILGEALLRRHGGGRFAALSAGSEPKGAVHPLALELLAELGFETEGLHSKGVGELLGADAPRLDLVITVCDRAAASCPLLPGTPLTVHWALPDPAAVAGSDAEQRAAFRRTFDALEARILGLVGLDDAALGSPALGSRLRALHAGLA